MPTLAPKLPYTHPFAGGYPRVGGQPLPTDPDAIDYLARVAAADGAAVEVGVAMAVDQFVKGCKADGIWSALTASCLLCGPRTLSGALVPLVGTAPTSYAFASGDYNRVTGLKGDGSTTYLDSGRADNADPQNSKHLAVYATEAPSADQQLAGALTYPAPVIGSQLAYSVADLFVRANQASSTSSGVAPGVGFHAVNRSSSSDIDWRLSGVVNADIVASSESGSGNIWIFSRNYAGATAVPTTARLAFYSIGSALDLALLDNRVSTLVAAIAAAM